MASVYKRKRDRNRKGSSWYISYVDERGVRRTVKGCPDKSATEGMSRKLESEAELRRRGVIDPRTDAYAAHEARALSEHLAEFQAALEAKGGTRKHALVSKNRAERVLTLAMAKRISDLSLSKAVEALASLRGKGLGAETVNHHIRALKSFSRWLWKDGRARDHALAHLSTTSSEADRRRKRRALTADEAGKLVAAAESGPTVLELSGPDRAMLYRLALGTGFRSAELASLTPQSFRLEDDPPCVVCEAGYTKNGHVAEQPIGEALASLLGPWLANRPAGVPVFNVPDRTAEMIRHDLKAASIPYEAPSGVVDFHALRSAYISHLVASGASVKTCQTLARHSTPSLTIGVYARSSLHDLTGAVESLPDLTATSPKSEPMAATGTDCGASLTAQGQRAGDGTGRTLSVAGGIDDEDGDSTSGLTTCQKPLDSCGLDASGREQSVAVASAGGENRTHTGVTPRRILSPLRLPFRHAGVGGEGTHDARYCFHESSVRDARPGTRRCTARSKEESPGGGLSGDCEGHAGSKRTPPGRRRYATAEQSPWSSRGAIPGRKGWIWVELRPSL